VKWENIGRKRGRARNLKKGGVTRETLGRVLPRETNRGGREMSTLL